MKKIEEKIKKIFVKVLGSTIKSGRTETVLDEINAVLILRPDRLGDMILSIPAVSLLRKFFKGKIVFVSGDLNKRALELFFPGLEKIIYKKRSLFSRAVLFVRLLAGKFDAVIDMHSYPFSVTTGLYSLLSGAKFRIGFSETEKVKNELSVKIFSAGISLNNDNLHESEKNLMLVEKLGIQRNNKAEKEALNVRIPEEAKVFAYRFYDTVGVKNSDMVIGIHPSLKKKDNRWNAQNYLDFMKAAKKKFGSKTVVLYGRGEEKEINRFKEMIKNENDVFVAPDNDIVNAMAIASRFSVFVCNDSGMMHAMSLVTKVAAIFGPSDPQRWGPIGNNSRVALRSPDLKCDSVAVDSVVEAVRTLVTSG